MQYDIRKNWVESFSLMVKKPVVLLPFFIIAFLEGLALELIYFSPRKPLLNLAGPMVRKFFGEAYLHYPGNLLILPKLFYYAQVLIYIFAGVLLSAITVGIVRNTRMNLPLKAKALIKNALRHYTSLVLFGVIATALVFLLRKFVGSFFVKSINLISAHLSLYFLKLFPFFLTLGLYLANIILQTFLLLSIPIIVLKKRMLFPALRESVVLGWRNFGSIFSLILVPFLVYLPISLLKTGAPQLIEKTLPEINLYIAILGIMGTIFIECFVFVCATQFLMDKLHSEIKR